MKLRLQSSELRLRLSQSDVERLAKAGRVEETIGFAPGQSLEYAIEARPAAEISAGFDGKRIEVTLPLERVADWAASEQTGIEWSGESLKILIEKDFQCLHKGAKDSDAFPNPLMDKF